MKRHWRLRMLAATMAAILHAQAAPAQEPSTGNEAAAAPEDLRALITSGITAARANDEKKLKELSRDLAIPEPERWFTAMFKENYGARMAAAYGVYSEQTEKSYPRIFSWLAGQEGELVFEDIKSLPLRPDNWCAQALVSAENENAGLVFYRVGVRNTNPSGLRTTTVGGYFTLVGGAYRRLDCQMVGLEKPAAQGGGRPNGPIRVGGTVQAGRLLKRVTPYYPEEARVSRISGTVRLHAIIGTDGRIKKLEVVSGHPMLQDAALHAVSQWVYRPTLFNGEPVEVDTTIDVIFTLNW